MNKEPKWLYRLEAIKDEDGLFYNNYGEFVLGIAIAPDCKTKEMPMDYDERYKQDGKDWHSSCTRIEDILHWYSVDDARYLLENGFRFRKYLATEYIEYDKETVFIKDTCIEIVELSLEEVFGLAI